MSQPQPARDAELDRFDLYELAVTAPEALSRFLYTVHGGRPRLLREDFAGSGALSRGWVRTIPGGRAIAVDRDPEPLRKLKGCRGVRAVRADVVSCGATADVIAATNFPVMYWHERRDLVRYLRLCRSRLRPGGVLAFDLYCGESAFVRQSQSVRLRAPDGSRVEYTWEQRLANPITQRVFNVIHFSVTPARGGRSRVLKDAFTYDWRVWSIPEAIDALRESGFGEVDVHDRLGDAVDSEGNLYLRAVDGRIESLEKDSVVYVIARRL